MTSTGSSPTWPRPARRSSTTRARPRRSPTCATACWCCARGGSRRNWPARSATPSASSPPRSRRCPVREQLRRLVASQAGLGYAVLLATAAAYFLVYTTNLGHLPTSFDYLSILNTTLPLVFVALGQSLVVLTGGIDLSVGGIVALCVAITATTVDGTGVTPYLWILMVLALGAACGGINGLIVAKARIAPILTTLASLSIFSGLALWVLPVPGGHFPPEVRLVLTNPSVPTGLIWLGLAIAGWLVLRRTRFGMRVYAVGSDEASALALGVPAAWVKVGVYALSGLCSTLAGVFYVSTTT